MPDVFLDLPPKEQSQILFKIAPQLGRSPLILEKDIWVCWVLEQLFSMPDDLVMAFKGGTSLSKVFNAIQRFSEDIDITLDYRCLDNSFDPFEKNISKTQLKKFSEKLKLRLKERIHGTVAPYLKKKLYEHFGDTKAQVEVDENGEKLYIHYSSLTSDINGYLKSSILVEFGGRNTTEPNEKHTIYPDVAQYLADLAFPTAEVNVLSPIRTFWEKATLIHVLCHKTWKESYERQSRHWYDLAMLAENSIGQQALLKRAILNDVIKHKNIFYHSPHAHYDMCNKEQLKLVPTDPLMLDKLKSDFNNMVISGMFYAVQPSFEKTIETLKSLEQKMNE